MSQTLTAILLAVAVTILVAVVVCLCIRSKYLTRLAVSNERLSSAEREAQQSEHRHAEALKAAREGYDRSVADLKEANRQALEQQISSIRAEMAAETEKMLKAREEQLNAEARRTFTEITGSLGKDFKEMKESFETNRLSQTQSSAALKENLETAVKNLERQTADIGRKADNLAEAMRSEVKGQGLWGEALFENMLAAEGFVKGRDYNREDVLRDEMGFAIKSEEGKGLRPDFVLHYPDNTDVIVDSKVSMVALNDYIAASDDEARQDAARRNLESVKNQVNLLARKDYVRFRAKSRHKTLDYVLMFIPNYGALQLAKELEPGIWRDAFSKNVLIVTEETAMPFLRMIRAAWASYEQVRSQKLIVEAAQRMIDRVADFAKAHAEMGQHIEKARECYEKCDLKLRDSGQSITVAAHQVIKLGVPANANKPLPDTVVNTKELPEKE